MSIGLTVRERESSDPISVQPAALGVSAWALRTRRGPSARAVRVDNWSQFKQRFFVEPDTLFPSYYVIKGLFDNCGPDGATAWVTRVQGAGGVALSAALADVAAAPVWTVTAGQYGESDPGAWANAKLFVQVVAASSGEAAKRDLLVLYQAATDTEPLLQERWKNLDNTNAVGVVNHSSRGSLWVKVTPVGAPTTVPAVQPAPVALSTVAGAVPGVDGAAPAETLYNTKLADFNGLAVQIIAAPDLQTPLQATNIDAYAGGRGDVLGIASATQGIDDTALETTYAALKKLKSYCSVYRGWVRVDSELGGDTLVPPLGHLVGAAYIRKVRDKGGYPHIAPAGALANLRGILEVDDGVYDQARLTRVNAAGFNPIVFQSGLGFFAKTSRTLSTLDKWYSTHVRIQANYFKTSFLGTFAPLEQDPNNEDTRRRLRNPIISFLEDQFTNGGLDDTGGFENNARVKCDVGNNPDAVRNARRLICDVTYRPVEVAESIEINLIRTTEGLKAGEK